MTQHEHGLQHFDFWSLWSPEIMLLTILMAVVYFLVVGPWRSRFPGSSPVSSGQKTLFIIGLLLLYTGMGSPLSVLGHHYLFSAHMLEMSLIYLAMPPLLLLGTPTWIFKRFIKPNRVVWWITNPLITVVLFNALFSFYHVPFIFDMAMANESLAFGLHTILLATAFLMWWPVVCPIPELSRLSDLQKLGYIFANGVLITPACALIIFADFILYDTYRNAPQLLSFMSSLDDQQTGGIIMKVAQEIIYGSALAYIFFSWFRREQRKDALELEDIVNA
jgi:putative membrane protein